MPNNAKEIADMLHWISSTGCKKRNALTNIGDIKEQLQFQQKKKNVKGSSLMEREESWYGLFGLMVDSKKEVYHVSFSFLFFSVLYIFLGLVVQVSPKFLWVLSIITSGGKGV